MSSPSRMQIINIRQTNKWLYLECNGIWHNILMQCHNDAVALLRNKEDKPKRLVFIHL